MEISLQMPTHGLICRDVADVQFRRPDRHVDVPRIAAFCEELGYHSLWFSDHMFMPENTGAGHHANRSGRRAYSPDAYLLDAVASMAAAAAVTSRVRLASGVLVSPTRHPLSDARQLMSVDVLSGGRLIVGVGAGWQKEEFDALGVPFASRHDMLEECVEVYRRCWTDKIVSFSGHFYQFEQVRFEPKPTAIPPIVVGTHSERMAEWVVRNTAGLYLTFLDPAASPHQYQKLLERVEREAERVGRDADTLDVSAMVPVLSIERSASQSRGARRRLMSGTSEQLLEDLCVFADAGYSRCTLHVEAPTGAVSEYMECVERVAEIISPAKEIASRRSPI